METHEMAARKLQQMDKLKDAFGIEGDINEGDAFNKELQEQKRQQRQAEREQRQAEREQKQAEWEQRKAEWEARAKEEASRGKEYADDVRNR